MTRKKLIAFALEFFKAGLDASEVGMPNFDQLIKTEYYKGKIDEILALPIEVPGDEEIIKQAHKEYPYSDINWNDTNIQRHTWHKCAIWTCSEIIKRNRP